MVETAYLTIAEAADRFRDGSLSPIDLVEAQLDRIARLNPLLNAYLHVSADLARALATDAAARLKASDDSDPLLGIPIGLKDLYDVAGQVTTAGSPIRAGAVAAEDCAVAASLRAAGAVFLGKHNMHEWAFGVTTNNPHFGPARNPWNTDHVPGGSSGGTGVALAAGLCFGGFGSDTGGSIRIPASVCGIVGLKPTTGRVSLRGVVPLSWSLDHAGPMARSVADVTLLLRAVDRYDPLDPTCLDAPREDPTSRLSLGARGVRLLVPDGYFIEEALPEVADLVIAGVRALERAGAKVESVSLPGAEALNPANAELIRCDAAAYHAEDLRLRADQFGADVLRRLRENEQIHGTGYALDRRLGVVWRRKLEALLGDDGLLALPTTPIPAPPIEGVDPITAARNLTSFTGPFNLTGLPALSVPAGFTSAGLPIGLQLVGRPWAEALVLQAGMAYERATDWLSRHPDI